MFSDVSMLPNVKDEGSKAMVLRQQVSDMTAQHVKVAGSQGYEGRFIFDFCLSFVPLTQRLSLVSSL